MPGEANYHLQFTPKYRRPVFGDGLVKTACANAMRHIAGKLGVELHAVEFGPDHTATYSLGKCRNYSASELAQRFRGASSRLHQTPTMEQTLQRGTRRSLLLEFRILLRISRTNNQRQNKILHGAPARADTGPSEAHKARTTREKQSSLQDYN